MIVITAQLRGHLLYKWTEAGQFWCSVGELEEKRGDENRLLSKPEEDPSRVQHSSHMMPEIRHSCCGKDDLYEKLEQIV